MFLFKCFCIICSFLFAQKLRSKRRNKEQANLYFVPFALANVFLVVALFVVRGTNF